MSEPSSQPRLNPIPHHPDNTFGLCLCCGCPWLPTVETMMQRHANNKLASMALLHFESRMRDDAELKQVLRDGKVAHFMQSKQNAHIVHRFVFSCMLYAVDHAN